MRAELQRLRNEGMSFDDMEQLIATMRQEEAAKIAQMEAEAEAKAKAKARAMQEKENKVRPAREKVAEAVINWLIVLEVVPVEEAHLLDPNDLLEELENMEHLFEVMGGIARRAPKAGLYSGVTRTPKSIKMGPGTLKVTPIPNDDDILAAFLAGLRKEGE